MTIFTIIALVCLVGLAWFWRNRFWRKAPVLKRTTARTWPASRVKAEPKRKFTVPF
jgi:hypothetical protein